MRGNDSNSDVTVDELDSVEELSGKLSSSPDEERLMRSVLNNEDESIKDGKLVAEAINHGVGSFTPDIFFKNLVSDYRNAERLYGKTIIRALTEYSPEYVKKNLSIPEFKDALSQRIEKNIKELGKRGVVDEQGIISEQGVKLAALVLYTEELDSLITKGLGKKESKERDSYGEKEDVVKFIKSRFRFKDVALKRSVHKAVRRGHTKIEMRDLQAYEREHKGKIQVIYAVDSSGSMRGDKIALAKRAGIALAFKAIEERNDVGLLIFTSKIEQAIPPMQDFKTLLMELVRMRAGLETDLAKTIKESVGLFSQNDCTKHLLLLTDMIPTKGEDPMRETLEAASGARDAGITISIVGIALDKEGEKLARKIVEIGNGRLYRVKNLERLDALLLEDYDALIIRE